MSKQDIKKATNRTWDVINLVSCAVGGALLTFTASTPEVISNVTVGQIVGAVLLSTAVVRVAHLIYNEQR